MVAPLTSNEVRRARVVLQHANFAWVMRFALHNCAIFAIHLWSQSIWEVADIALVKKPNFTVVI